MPSSTSSSDRSASRPSGREAETPDNNRLVPGGAWGATWLATLALVAVAGGGLELWLRGRGYRPSVKDDEYAWAWQRVRAGDGSPRTVAVLGASRILLAFDAATFARDAPNYKAVQLAVDGTTPAGSLIDLAGDPEFRGIALVDTTESGILVGNYARQDAYVTAYHRRFRAPGAMAERWLATAVQSRVALPSAGGMRALGALWQHAVWPPPPYVTTFADRTQFADFSLTSIAERRRAQLDRLPPAGTASAADAAAWLEEALRIEPHVAAIRARGGQVVLLRMPTCDERWQFDETTTPRALYWDRLAARLTTRTGAVAIHFRDYPELASLPCPDTSHIDSRDGPRFTHALIDILKRFGILR